jgi:hypothetical protein
VSKMEVCYASNGYLTLISHKMRQRQICSSPASVRRQTGGTASKIAPNGQQWMTDDGRKKSSMQYTFHRPTTDGEKPGDDSGGLGFVYCNRSNTSG